MGSRRPDDRDQVAPAADEQALSPPFPDDAPALFVSLDLDAIESSPPHVFADDLTISGRPYRRLDAPYYAWLRLRVGRAKKALEGGRIDAATWEAVRARFERVHAWAIEHLGEEALQRAVRSLDERAYQGPRVDDDEGFLGIGAGVSPRGPRDDSDARVARCSSGMHGPIGTQGSKGMHRARVSHASHASPAVPSTHTFPEEGSWRCTERVTEAALHQVDAICEQAFALGWSRAALYQNRANIAFPCGGQWGLVCFLSPDTRIAAVTREGITIERSRGATTRFPNPAARPFPVSPQPAGVV